MNFKLIKKADDLQITPARRTGPRAMAPIGDSGGTSNSVAVPLPVKTEKAQAVQKKKYTAAEIRDIHKKNKEVLDLVRVLEVAAEETAKDKALSDTVITNSAGKKVNPLDCDSSKLSDLPPEGGPLSKDDMVAIKRWVPSWTGWPDLFSKLNSLLVIFGNSGLLSWVKDVKKTTWKEIKEEDDQIAKEQLRNKTIDVKKKILSEIRKLKDLSPEFEGHGKITWNDWAAKSGKISIKVWESYSSNFVPTSDQEISKTGKFSKEDIELINIWSPEATVSANSDLSSLKAALENLRSRKERAVATLANPELFSASYEESPDLPEVFKAQTKAN